MIDIYEQLARFLDNLPAGFPATDSGVELRILKRLFTEQEAKAAISLTMFPESAAAIAKRIGKDASDMETLLYSMSKKGLIGRVGKKHHLYMAANFIFGIWEFHVNNIDEELVRDVDEYLPLMWEKTWSKQKTQQLRVIPVSKSITAEMNIMPYNVAEQIIKEQSKIMVAPCICRKEQAMAGHGCDRPLETCLILGPGAFFYEQNGIGRSITQNQALDILSEGIEKGLVLQPSNSQNPDVICMCCGCCCLVLKNLNTMDEPAKVACTSFYVQVSEDYCTGCQCCENICQMAAIKVVDESAVVNLLRCIGCGLCVAQCESDAVCLVQKDDPDAVPGNRVEQYMNMAQERGLM